MIRLSDALLAMAEHVERHADITAYPLVPGREITNTEMDVNRDARLRLGSEIAALSKQAKARGLQRSEVEAFTARLVYLAVAVPMQMHLAVADALMAETDSRR